MYEPWGEIYKLGKGRDVEFDMKRAAQEENNNNPLTRDQFKIAQFKKLMFRLGYNVPTNPDAVTSSELKVTVEVNTNSVESASSRQHLEQWLNSLESIILHSLAQHVIDDERFSITLTSKIKMLVYSMLLGVAKSVDSLNPLLNIQKKKKDARSLASGLRKRRPVVQRTFNGDAEMLRQRQAMQSALTQPSPFGFAAEAVNGYSNPRQITDSAKSTTMFNAGEMQKIKNFVTILKLRLNPKNPTAVPDVIQSPLGQSSLVTIDLSNTDLKELFPDDFVNKIFHLIDTYYQKSV